MEPTTRVQILDEVICISHSANNQGKGTNTAILLYPPSYGYIVGNTVLFNLGMTTDLGEGKTLDSKQHSAIKNDLVSYPALAEGQGKYIHSKFKPKTVSFIYPFFIYLFICSIK